MPGCWRWVRTVSVASKAGKAPANQVRWAVVGLPLPDKLMLVRADESSPPRNECLRCLRRLEWASQRSAPKEPRKASKISGGRSGGSGSDLKLISREWRSGSASPCQGEGRGFESRLPLRRDRGYRVGLQSSTIAALGCSAPPVAAPAACLRSGRPAAQVTEVAGGQPWTYPAGSSLETSLGPTGRRPARTAAR